jgi:hypothetical protein
MHLSPFHVRSHVVDHLTFWCPEWSPEAVGFIVSAVVAASQEAGASGPLSVTAALAREAPCRPPKAEPFASEATEFATHVSMETAREAR